MRSALILLAGVACAGGSRAPAPVASAPDAGPPSPARVEDRTLASAALGVDKRYRVWLPAGYDSSGKRYPVLYMLHGLGATEDSWLERGDLAAVAERTGLTAIVVMPDGDSSFYANWATPVSYDDCLGKGNPFRPKEDVKTYCVREARYEDYIVKDLVAGVDATYRTIPERAARGIGGLSMGGFGALMLAMRNPGVFSTSASHSGVDALLYAGPYPYEKGKVELGTDVVEGVKRWGPIGAHLLVVFGTAVDGWRAHDPAAMAGSLAPGRLALYLDCGTEDVFALHNGMQYLHEVLDGRGVAHEYYLGPGGHDFGFWHERLDDSLAFHQKHLAAPR